MKGALAGWTAAFSMVLLADGFAFALGAARSLLFARWMTPAQFGILATALQAVPLLASLLSLGLSNAIGRYITQHDAGTRGSFLRALAFWPVTLSLLAAAGIALAPLPAGRLLVGAPVTAGLGLWLAAALPVTLLANLAVGTANGLLAFRARSLLQVSGAAGALALGAFLVPGTPTASSAMAAVAGGTAGGVLLGAMALRPFFLGQGHPLSAQQRGALSGQLWRMGRGMLFCILGTQLLSLSDRWLLTRLAGEAHSGIYSLGAFYALLLVTPWMLLSELAFPGFAADWNAGRRTRCGRRVRQVSLGVLLTGGAAVLAVLPVLFVLWERLAGTGYAPAGGILPTLLAAAFARLVCAFLLLTFLLEERYAVLGATVVGGAGLNVLLACLWIPAHPLEGAALASAVSWGGIATVQALLLGRGTRALRVPVLAGLLVVGTGAALAAWAWWGPWLALPALACSGILPVSRRDRLGLWIRIRR